MLAGHVLGAAHTRDRLVFTAVGALGYQLEAAQTVHAAEAARELRRAQPGLAAGGAGRPPQGTASVAWTLLVHCSIIAPHPADEESRGAIAVWAQLQTAAIDA